MNYRDRKQAIAYLRENGIPCGDFFLSHLAKTGSGPLFRYLGRHPVYAEEDLDAWIESRLGPPVRSRSEAAAALLNAPTVKQKEDPPLSPPTRTTRQHGLTPDRRRPGRPSKQPTPQSLSVGV